ALPVIETQEGEVSAYIPTNVISITDGQIYLEPDLFFAGQRPAVNVGISVSRVGGSAQIKAMKKISGSLRLDLSAFRELEAFAQLGTELDKATQAQLDRGFRMVEILKQPQYKPMPISEQVLIIWCGSTGFLDALPVSSLASFETQFLEHVRTEFPEILEGITSSGEINAELEEKLKSVAGNFSKDFAAKLS
ncbi:F0F1 ATP synthase subunit alpha, partial [bacterium TMED181]